MRLSFPLCLFGWLLLGVSTSSLADVQVSNSWARATFPMAKTGAVYLTLSNQTNSQLHLLSVKTPSNIAEDVQIHTTEMTDGMMRMRQLKDGIVITPHSQHEFVPGGDHIMLIGLIQGLDEGSQVPLTLVFADGSEREISVEVKHQDRGASSQHHH
ncbi:copper chaperone PCu(A)C [Alteromonas sp. 14N.309.X.WAT.G.H12]|uniref:copper chaperone PCu(A)C n=1 Tax=Alteromonas sp. 14N.309.X.WAT.G.H12 TaxID=3120824 RepID=UPI002FD5B4DD